MKKEFLGGILGGQGGGQGARCAVWLRGQMGQESWKAPGVRVRRVEKPRLLLSGIEEKKWSRTGRSLLLSFVGRGRFDVHPLLVELLGGGLMMFYYTPLTTVGGKRSN